MRFGNFNERKRADLQVLIVAGFASVRAGLHALLCGADGVEVLGAVDGVDDALARLLLDTRPDVLLLDTSGDGASEATDSVSRVLPLVRGTDADAPGLVVIGDDPERHVGCLATSNARGWGYLLRESDGPQIIGAVRAASDGLVVLDRAIRLPVTPVPAVPRPVVPTLAAPGETFPGDALTPREIEVLDLMAEGLPNKIIASRLKISLHTAKFHVAQILGKLDAASRTEAVTIGARRGYVTL